MGRAIFSTRMVVALIAVGTAAFFAALYLMLSDDGAADGRAGANSYSVSAIGHKAFVDTLRRLGIPVLVSRFGSAEKVGRFELLVLAEPTPGVFDDARTARLLDAGRVLLILPKRRGRPDPARPDWLSSVAPFPVAAVERMARRIDGSLTVWRGRLDGRLEPHRGGPVLGAVQLIASRRMTPLIGDSSAMLLGRLDVGWRHIWVLSDPDIVSNHGIARPGNEHYLSRLIEAVRPAGGAVIFDETIHGLSRDLRLWRAMFDVPFVAVLVQAVIGVVVLLWATAGRFGAPLPAPPALAPGKAGLIENTAGLVRFGGHDAEILGRYADVVLRDAARRCHAPRNLDAAATIAWLDRVGARRGVGAGYAALSRAAGDAMLGGPRDDARLVRAAQNLHRWKQRMIHGPGSRQRD